MQPPPVTPLLIAQMDAPHRSRGGDFHYRTFAPGRAMAAEPAVHVIGLDNIHHRKHEVLREADVVVLNAVCDPDLLPVLRERRERRLVTVYEINDDVSAVPPWNPVHRFFQQRRHLLLFCRLARACDAVQFSVEELRRLYGYLSPRAAVLPNQVSALPPARPPRPDDRIVVGWGGSLGHLEDMAAIAGPLCDWLRGHPEVDLHLMGSEPIWRLFQGLPEGRRRFTPPGDIERYYAFLQGLDIGLAPLLDTGFNRSRSDVKFLEYAAAGVVPVVQALAPYLGSVADGRTGFLFRDAAGLIGILGPLAADGDLRRRVGSAARAYVAAERLERDHAGRRVAFYRELLARAGAAPRPAAECAARFEALAAGAEVAGRHAILRPGPFEEALHAGLVRVEEDGGAAEAAARFREAAALAPGDYQPYLCLAEADPEGAGRWLTQALERSPRSVQALVALGRHHAGRGEPQRAMERLTQAMALCPDYEAPYIHLAQVLKDQGLSRDAARVEERGAQTLAGLLPPRP
jgi:glycosyltransferase involved in cell wall biosynthesis